MKWKGEIVMAPPEVRSGAGIREFLEYYLLVTLEEGPATRGKIIEAAFLDREGEIG